MALTHDFVKKVINAYPNKVIGKKFNYKAKKNENGTWEIWVQEFEEMPWKLAMVKYNKGDTIQRRHKVWNINWDVMNGANQNGSF